MATTRGPDLDRVRRRRDRVLEQGEDLLREGLAEAGVPAEEPIVDADPGWLPTLAWGVADRAERPRFQRRHAPVLDRPRELTRAFKLRDLAWILACEQNEEWRAPDGPSRSTGAAERSFDRLHRHCSEEVRDRLRSKLRTSLEGLDRLAESAWSKLFEHHLSRRAPRPFLAMSQVATWLVTVAYHEGLRGRADAAPQEDLELAPTSPELSRGEREEIRDAIDDCLSRLSPRQRLVVSLRLFANVAPSSVAERLGTTRPNVTNLYKAGIARLRACLEAKGFSLEGET